MGGGRLTKVALVLLCYLLCVMLAFPDFRSLSTVGVRVDFELELGGEKAPGLTVPVKLWPEGSPSQSVEKTGQQTVTFEGLAAGTTYVADLFGTEDTATPKNPPPETDLIGYATEDGTYTYEYEVVGSSVESWTDHFGTQHSGASATVTEDEAVSEHRVTVEWPSETRDLSVETKWRLPPSPVGFTERVQTGQAVLAGSAEEPVFEARRHAGTRSKQLAYNVYPAGSWEVHPVGHLPLSVEGELEDFVRAVFVGPGGEEMGQSAHLERAAELAVALEVRAAGTLSPVVYGVRIS